MKVLKIIGIVILAIVAIVLILGLIAPRQYHVERSIVIQAPRALVFNQVQYWKNWEDWSPWAKADATMKCTYEGADGYPGSLYRWSGEKVGKGEMSNTGLKPNEEIQYHLKFIEPFEDHADGFLRAEDVEGDTRLSWALYGKSPFPWNALSLFMNLDQRIGKDFEEGLALLKEISEKEAAQIASYKIEKIPFATRHYAAIEKELTMAEIQSFFQEAFGKIAAALGEKGIQRAGAPCGLYFTWDEQTQKTKMAAAIPIAVKKDLEAEIKIITLPKRTAYVADYYGSYEKSMLAYMAFDEYFKNNGLVQSTPVIEEYITDPSQEADASKWLTRIYFFAE